MRGSPIRDMHYFAATCLGLNYADFATTIVVLSRGAVESNPLFLFLGGPLSPPSMMIKLIALPLLVLWIAYYGHATTLRRRVIYNSFFTGLMTLLSYAVVNNITLSVLLAAK